MLSFINRGISSFNDYFTDDVGNLAKYLDMTPGEYDFLDRLIEANKTEIEDVFYYLSILINDFKREGIPDNFRMDGYDFYTCKYSENEYSSTEGLDKDLYVEFMNDAFGYDFSDSDVYLYFLNENNLHCIPDCLELLSYGGYRLFKEGNSDWEDDDELLIIGSYSPDVLIIVRDDKVYVMESSREYEKESWKYICDVSNIKNELYKSKKYSDAFWNYRD